MPRDCSGPKELKEPGANNDPYAMYGSESYNKAFKTRIIASNLKTRSYN